MSYEHKANTGTLFPNNKKADNHPDYKGKIKVGEVEYDIAGWLKDGANGKFLSLKISEPFQPAPQSTTEKISEPFQQSQPSPQNTTEKIINSTGIPF